MSERKDQEAAFPFPYGGCAHPGMSLRDYFAAEAMGGILRATEGFREPFGVARLAYEFADAMMQVRKS